MIFTRHSLYYPRDYWRAVRGRSSQSRRHKAQKCAQYALMQTAHNTNASVKYAKINANFLALRSAFAGTHTLCIGFSRYVVYFKGSYRVEILVEIRFEDDSRHF